MDAEDEFLPISALTQFYYCPRRAGLTLIEQQWADNLYTAEGTVLHERVHSGGEESRGDIRIFRAVRVRSLRLGLSGVTDSLEFIRVATAAQGIRLENASGFWTAVPIEYKHGTIRDEEEYKVQLCAQAMCLEEMLGMPIEEGYLYFGGPKRRVRVQFSSDLRRLVEAGVKSLRQMAATGITPPRQPGPKCAKCSMRDVCMPSLPVSKAGDYVAAMLEMVTED